MADERRHELRLMVDQAKCESVGVCVRECPDVFRFRWGNKRATVIADPVPTELRERCLDIVERCPSGAIKIIEC
ncbi:MAG: ferredoxin [Chitinivibrionales bacterium]|nr:ferredoxin [Chitinivibrionales bacterium]